MQDARTIFVEVDAVIWLIVIFVCLKHWRKSKRQQGRKMPTFPIETAQESSSESESELDRCERSEEVMKVRIEGKIIKKEDYDEDTFTYYVQPEGQNICYKFDEIADKFAVGDVVVGDTDEGTLNLLKIKSDIDGSIIEVKTTKQ